MKSYTPTDRDQWQRYTIYCTVSCILLLRHRYSTACPLGEIDDDYCAHSPALPVFTMGPGRTCGEKRTIDPVPVFHSSAFRAFGERRGGARTRARTCNSKFHGIAFVPWRWRRHLWACYSVLSDHGGGSIRINIMRLHQSGYHCAWFSRLSKSIILIVRQIE